MSNQWWSRPVHVAVSNGTSVVVNNNRLAAEMLLKWPLEGSEKAAWARRAILRSMERPDDPGPLLSAQMWFEAAAEEAGLRMDPPPPSMAPKTFKTPVWRRRKSRH